jgi:hypothetical protein
MNCTLPLALQILNQSSDNHELHIAGKFQDGTTVDYLNNMVTALKLNDRVFFYGPIDDINDWLKDKNYLLCTAISEGCPNNVLEAMAKGIKPVIHNWPGSKSLFNGFTFNTVQEAADMMTVESSYKSGTYRTQIETLYGKNIYNNVAQLVQEVCGKTKTYHDMDWNATIRNKVPDCYVVSYPKSGRTWLRIFFQLAIAKIMDENFVIQYNLIFPDESLCPSLMFTHTHIGWTPKAETIFLTRDPKDVLVSSFYHCKHRGKTIPEDMTISEFIRSDGGGISLIAKWHRDWEERLKGVNCLRVKYEDLHEYPHETFEEILSFIGIIAFPDCLDIFADNLAICIHASSFDEVKKNLQNGKLAALFNSSAELSRYQPTSDDPESNKRKQQAKTWQGRRLQRILITRGH